MIFSVYDYPKKQYKYFEVAASTPPTAWFRRPVEEVKDKPDSLFCCTEVLAVKLPPDAKEVGIGPDARGVIATTQASVGSSDPAGSSASSGMGASGIAVGVLAFMAGWVAKSAKSTKPAK